MSAAVVDAGYDARMQGYFDDPATKLLLGQFIFYGKREDTTSMDARSLKPGWEQDFQRRIKDLEQQGETYKLESPLSRFAYFIFTLKSPDHPLTIQTVQRLHQIHFEQGRTNIDVSMWLLQRAANRLDNPRTLQLVQREAMQLYNSKDPRVQRDLARIVTDIAQWLPNGLGWGTAAVTALQDEEAYNRHAVLQYKALEAHHAGNHTLAKAMWERCLAYYQGIGPHWLVSPRKITVMNMLAMIAFSHEGQEAAQTIFLEGKRIAQRELGTQHEVTQDISWQYGMKLMACKRPETALSLLQKVIRVRQETLGPYHYKVLDCQAVLGGVFMSLGKAKEAEAAIKDAYECALKSGGPQGIAIKQCLSAYYHLLQLKFKRHKEANELKERARKLGCDVSDCMGTIHVFLAKNGLTIGDAKFFQR